MSARSEAVTQLRRVFGDIAEATIATLYDENEGNLEAVVDILLNMPVVSKLAEPQGAPQNSANQRLENDREREKNVQTILAMFGNDLTKSVVSTVYSQNEGDVAQAVDMLLDIYHDEDAIEAIRTMGAKQKKELEQEMKKEEERRASERQAQLQREIEEDKRKMAEEEARRAAEKAAEKRAQEHLDQLKRQREQAQKEIENQKREEEKLRAEKDKERLAELEKQRKGQEERNRLLLEEVERQAAERARVEAERQAMESNRLKQEKQKLEELKAKELLVSRIAQQSALVTLGVRYGSKTVIVSWSLGADMKATPGDWIGFYKLGMPNEKYREYIKTNGEREGSHHFTAPKTPGLYQFKYFVNGSYTNVVAQSSLIHIGPQLSMTATLNGSKLMVTSTLNAGEVGTYDWFGLYHAEENNNKNYIAMRYFQQAEIGQKSVTFTFDAPRTPGDYVVRFFPARCKYTSVAHSPAFRVLNRDKVSLEIVKDATNQRPLIVRVRSEIHSVDPSSKDYVAIYKLSSPNNAYVSYAYVDLQKGLVDLPAPTEVDSYEVRYHSGYQSRYADVCRSQSFAVPNTDVVMAEVASGVLTVSWSIHSLPRSTWDWVGIFQKDSPSTKFVQYKYVDATANALVFDVPREHGAYEARYFSNALGKYVDFRKSQVFHIA